MWVINHKKNGNKKIVLKIPYLIFFLEISFNLCSEFITYKPHQHTIDAQSFG